ncbi:hypothetical protein ACO0K9_17010 [Undibacterium sp. Ji50W]|uniref:hypothetical protein n=1 Tax=Undibacterium sp. Ji50W TaxID=3413041 RepID=UPI003BF2B89D
MNYWLKKNHVLYLVTGLITSCITVYVLSDGDPNTVPEKIQKNNSVPKTATAIPTNLAPILHAEKCVPNPNNSLVTKSQRPPLKEARAKIIEISENSRGNPQELLNEFNNLNQNDPQRAELYSVALFDLASICFRAAIPGKPKAIQYEQLGCNLLPLDMIRKPLSILDRRIIEKSILAKTYYLINALELAPIYQRIGTQGDIEYSKEILMNAEKYGFESAKEGAIEANYVMSRAYREGLFDKKDMTKAASYLIPIVEKNRGEASKEILNKINSTLSKEDQQNARDIASGCQSRTDSNVFINPFN